jgi:hypothetical protein
MIFIDKIINNILIGFFLAFFGMFAITVPQPIGIIVCIIMFCLLYRRECFYKENFCKFLGGYLLGFLFSIIWVVVFKVPLLYIVNEYFLLEAFMSGFFYVLLFNSKKPEALIVGSMSLPVSSLYYLFLFDIIGSLALVSAIAACGIGVFLAYKMFIE